MYDKWIAQFPAKTFKKDARLFMQGDAFDCCYYLKKGICSQLIDYENGTEVVAKYYFPGDMLNIWGVLKHRTSYTSTVVAKTDICAVVIPAVRIRKELDDNFDFYRWVVESMLENNQYVYEQYQKKSKGSAAEIVCYAILALSQERPNGKTYLSKDFAFCDLAQHLRIHRITVSHIFKVLQEKKVIRKCDFGWEVLSVHALEEYAQGNEILNYGAS